MLFGNPAGVEVMWCFKVSTLLVIFEWWEFMNVQNVSFERLGLKVLAKLVLLRGRSNGGGCLGPCAGG